ncbi:Amt family ammonium transporter [Natronocella acetinitrilica]|uniref:Amt family ammonium transporter n=2 Tax=Natronocella acetinitrilica TaxID=414046 RepID=A0AAE3G380_9GAMM|nr:Amt family ammonium transporter [Natronocella acetinitrilica]
MTPVDTTGSSPSLLTADAQLLRDLTTTIPGAIFRFRRDADGEFHIESMSEGLRRITGVPDNIDLTDLRGWISRIPLEHVEPYLQSIDASARSLTPWSHEWPIDVPKGRIWLQGLSQPHQADDGSVIWNGLLLDVTRRKRAEEERMRVETDYRSIFENTTEGIFRSSPDGRLLDANAPLARMHGFSTKEELLEAVNDLAKDYYVHPEDRTTILEVLNRDGHVEGFEAEVYRIGTGGRFRQQENARVIRDAAGEVLYYQGTVRDVTEEYQAHRLASRRAEILELIARDAPLESVLKQVIRVVEEYREGYTVAVVLQRQVGLEIAAAPNLPSRCCHTIDCRAPEEVGGAIAAAIASGGIRLQTDVGRVDDSPLQISMREVGFSALLATPIKDSEGTVLGLLAAFSTVVNAFGDDVRGVLRELAQITAIALEQQRLAARLFEQAHFDALTGLPNRVLMEDRMNQVMREARRRGCSAAIMLLDLDEFKLVNDTLGHDAGDALLQQVSVRLRACVRQSDTVARFGGDEFVLIQPFGDDGDDPRGGAERVLETLNEPFLIDGRQVSARPSIGIALYPQDGHTVAQLIRAADTAMYVAKQGGKNQYRFFDESMNLAVNERLRLERELRDALQAGLLSLCFQPRVSLQDGSIAGAEALLRWQHPERGLLMPADFLPVAEQAGLMPELDRHVLALVMRQFAAWSGTAAALTFSMQLSAETLARRNVGDELGAFIAESCPTGMLLELEITESALLQDADRAAGELEALRKHCPDLRLALGGFGAGYSSLRNLAKLPIETLKIDRSFVADLGQADKRRIVEPIIRAICDLGSSLSLWVVADGVETAEQQRRLLALGCDRGQGLLFEQQESPADFQSLFESGATFPR